MTRLVVLGPVALIVLAFGTSVAQDEAPNNTHKGSEHQSPKKPPVTINPFGKVDPTTGQASGRRRGGKGSDDGATGMPSGKAAGNTDQNKGRGHSRIVLHKHIGGVK